MEFEKRNLEMSRNVLKSLIERGLIVGEEDALQKLHEPEWIAKHGYGHVVHVLRGAVGREACRLVFAERHRSSSSASGGDGNCEN